MESTGGKANTVLFPVVIIAVVCILLGAYLSVPLSGPESSSTATSVVKGVVTGYVTAGPSQPTCSTGQSCIENMSGYSLVFTPQCEGLACVVSMAPLSPSGHYSALLVPGTYTITGLYPSCPWLGCSQAFPKMVTVQGGLQTVLDIQIDTGIR